MSRYLIAAAVLAAALAAPAAAQIAQSDVQGPILTGSDVAGGGTGPAFRSAQNALFRHAAERTYFRSAAAACDMVQEAHGIATELREGTLRMPPGFPPAPPAAAQRDVHAVMADSQTTGPAAERVLAALRGPVAAAPDDAAERLVHAVAGLLRDETTCPPERRGSAQRVEGSRAQRVEGDRWYRAIIAYQAYVEEAPDAVLSPAPAELLAIGAVIHRLVQAGLDALASR